jgi:hypothetical protein
MDQAPGNLTERVCRGPIEESKSSNVESPLEERIKASEGDYKKTTQLKYAAAVEKIGSGGKTSKKFLMAAAHIKSQTTSHQRASSFGSYTMQSNS